MTSETQLDATTGGRSHRLGELVRVLSGCRATDAELAVLDEPADHAVAPDEALDTVAAAMVRLRAARRSCAGGQARRASSSEVASSTQSSTEP